MPDINFVCSICSQTFTRRWRGKTHNINLHFGSAEIVRLIDYIIGRLNGRYSPGDPSLYRSKKANVFSHESNSTAFDHDKSLKTSTRGVNRIAENTETFSHFKPTTHQNRELDQKDSLSDMIKKNREVMFKTAKLKKILDKYGSHNDVQQMMMQVVSNCMIMGNYAPLDMALDEATKFDQLNDPTTL
jgi:hypothetical protein